MFFRFVVQLFKSPLDLFYSIKWALAYIAIRLYNLFHGQRFDLYDISAVGDPVKRGFVVPQLEKDLESPMPDSHLREGADEIFFYGINSNSDCFVTRIARGINQVAEAWIYIKLADGRTFHLKENIDHQHPHEGKCIKFSCGRLQMHYLSPMRNWRIHYCGMLKQSSQENEQTDVFVKFVCIWTASSNAYDLDLDSNAEGFASSIARASWKIPFLPPVLEFTKALNFYAQSGVLMGTISVEDGPDMELYLFGEKVRNTGNCGNIAGCKFTNILGNIPTTGLTFHVTKASAPNIFHNLPLGFVVQPDGNLKVVTDLNINMKTNGSERSNSSFHTQFTAGDSYEINGKIVGEPIILYRGEGLTGFLELSLIEFHENGINGKGLIISWEVYKEPKRHSQIIEAISFPQHIPLTVTFKDKISHLLDISGGKGSSLGKLTQLSSEIKTFQVPKGLIVTTAAFNEFMNREISNEIMDMANIAYGNEKGNLKDACKRVSNAIDRTLLPNQICQSILRDLKSMYGIDLNQYKFAVRSSATGEDTESMSSAGQMDTFLGVQGLKDIFLSVKKCWASQFKFNAVQYKRRYGQLINSPMAVVIQEMVDSEISGVIFTCDPVTCNPSYITITTNYGLGETVVSGSVEPDTITLKRKSNEVHFFNMKIGEKRQKMIVKETGGTLNEDIPENSRNACCLTREQSERLGRLAVKIEKYFRTPRDIEWAIFKEKIYILQSRPITNFSTETEFEIKHEFDPPLRSEKDFVTVANTGEVMPGAASPLGMELIIKLFGLAFKNQEKRSGEADNNTNCNYYNSGFINFCHHMMMTVVDMIARNGVDTPVAKGFMISIFGRVLEDPELLSMARERSKAIPEPTLMAKIRMYKAWLFFSSEVEKSKKELHNYHFKFMKCKTAAETFSALLNSCDDFHEIIYRHLETSMFSSTSNIFLFLVLCNTKKELDSDVYSDFATLLASSSDVESADIPHAMQEVANQIAREIEREKFKSMSVEEALKWLQSSSSSAGQKFRQFIQRHGHRCLKEFDVKSITWEMNPKPLVKALQNMASSGPGKKKEKISNGQLFSRLHIPLSFFTRCALRFVLYFCRRGIRGRETTKSISVKAMDYWRKGFRRLGQQMVSEGRIADQELVFFFTLEELKELIRTRSPSLISRASLRMKFHPKFNAYKFPEIMRGVPKPMNDEDTSAYTSDYVADFSMKGTPVSQGITKGFARVAITLEEAANIKNGEILITYSTDICWSPYFPILSGVVTELGGLISHGAVVSREYGLPCVVGLQGATKKFRTGDFVLLDGKKGILQRLPQPQAK